MGKSLRTFVKHSTILNAGDTFKILNGSEGRIFRNTNSGYAFSVVSVKNVKS